MDIAPLAGSNGPGNDTASELLRLYRTQKRVVEEEKGVLRSLLKRAKSEGLNSAMLSSACRKAKFDTDDVISDMRDELHYMSLMRIEISPEALFSGWSSATSPQTQQNDDIWDAEDRGYHAGRHGQPLEDCPYPPGSLAAKGFVDSWHKGQASIARELGQNVEQAVPSRARPQRSPAALVPSIPELPMPKRRGRPPKNAQNNGHDTAASPAS